MRCKTTYYEMSRTDIVIQNKNTTTTIELTCLCESYLTQSDLYKEKRHENLKSKLHTPRPHFSISFLEYQVFTLLIIKQMKFIKILINVSEMEDNLLRNVKKFQLERYITFTVIKTTPWSDLN